MLLCRNVIAGLAACLVLAAIISYVVNFDRIEYTTFTLGIIGLGLAMVATVLTTLLRRRGGP